MNQTIDYYTQHSNEFKQQYLSKAAEEVHSCWLNHLPSKGQVLDVGAGVGRDALWLSELGLEVVAIEPSKGLRKEGKELTQKTPVHWIDDQLPDLKKTQALNLRFDLILLSAVWMHIHPESRHDAFKKLISLLNTDGKLIITLRHGKSPDKRKMYPVDVNELESFASKHMLTLCGKYNDKDKLNRNDVYWDTLVFQNS